MRTVLVASVLALALVPGAAASATVSTSGPGTMQWVQRYNGPGNANDIAESTAVGPDGNRIYVTGISDGGTSTGYDAATIAYDATTGAQLWLARYNDPANGADGAYALTVSPSGRTVFVTGFSYDAVTTGYDYLTAAYDAATGSALWVSRYHGPGVGHDTARAIAVSPDGSTVFVTGASYGGTSTADDYATVAYSAATGAQLWVERYNGPSSQNDMASAIAVDPAGNAVYVTGASFGSATAYDYATVAYNAATGAQLWVERYNGPGNGFDEAHSVTVSPSGGAVYVTGYSTGTNGAHDYATVAYSAATGAMLWLKRYSAKSGGFSEARRVCISPDGSVVYVTGYSDGGQTTGYDYLTIAYHAATGATLWARRWVGLVNVPLNNTDAADGLALGPGGGTLYVTGNAANTAGKWNYATVAYNAATGTKLWVASYAGPAGGDDAPTAIATNPATGAVYVTGQSVGTTSGEDYATVAYRG